MSDYRQDAREILDLAGSNRPSAERLLHSLLSERDRSRASNAVILRDMDEMLVICGLGQHARPKSPHEVIQSELIPRLREMADATTWEAT